MIDKKLERIDQKIELLKTRIESGGPEVHGLCKVLEGVVRDLKVFDQKRHRAEQMDNDLKNRFEAIVLSLEKITRILKENGLI
ncbi:MAG: hypothetical protein KAW40_00015 [Candidatus Aenigmarchaeota archaeon]|nr:hypothetical protein [Candidatus Aenigmarchaeota archaeon]